MSAPTSTSTPAKNLNILFYKRARLNYQIGDLERDCLEYNIKLRNLECEFDEQTINKQDTSRLIQQINAVARLLEIDERDLRNKLVELADICMQIDVAASELFTEQLRLDNLDN